jgi:hypothetical protein
MKMKSYIFAFLYLIFPLIAIPYWAHLNGSWIMLLGIAASYFGTMCYYKDFGSIYFVSFVVIVAYCIYTGQFSFRDLYITMFICMTWGFFTALIAAKYKEMAKQEEEEREFGIRE